MRHHVRLRECAPGTAAIPLSDLTNENVAEIYLLPQTPYAGPAGGAPGVGGSGAPGVASDAAASAPAGNGASATPAEASGTDLPVGNLSDINSQTGPSGGGGPSFLGLPSGFAGSSGSGVVGTPSGGGGVSGGGGGGGSGTAGGTGSTGGGGTTSGPGGVIVTNPGGGTSDSGGDTPPIVVVPPTGSTVSPWPAFRNPEPGR